MNIRIDNYDQLLAMRDFERAGVTPALLKAVKGFAEAEDLEELILGVLVDPNRTPHGPAELVDIMTLHLTCKGLPGVAAFVLKGRSFRKVSPQDISHQIFRLRKIADLKYAVLGCVGNLLDQARDEFIQTACDLNVDYTIVDAIDFARMAVIHGVLCPRDARRLQDGRCPCGYRSKGDRLNHLQLDALAQLKTSHDLGHLAGVVIMPTGSGKTRIAAVDAQRTRSKRILFIAHTHEILDGAESEFAHVFGQHAVCRTWRVASSLPPPSVHLCTIQSVSRNVEKIPVHAFDYLIVDEFHHAAATSYRRLLQRIKPNFLLALTATPFRGDRQDVIELCNGNVVVDHELRTGIDTGILVPYEYYGCFDDVDYARLRRYSGGYSVRDLDRSLIIPERDAAIIEKWQSMSDGLPTLAFCCSQRHAQRMARAFVRAGIKAAPYLGSTGLDDRSKLVEDLRYGSLKVLCAVDVLNEGVDIPFLECLLFLRPTESKRIFFQQLGRGLRKHPGKKRVVVLDFIGNFQNAYRIVEYLGLQPEEAMSHGGSQRFRSSKDVVDIPLGCSVVFDDRVVDVFASQILAPRNATRHNIAQILIYLYRRTSRHLGRAASAKEVNRLQLLDSQFYRMVFGSWDKFAAIVDGEDYSSEGGVTRGHSLGR